MGMARGPRCRNGPGSSHSRKVCNAWDVGVQDARADGRALCTRTSCSRHLHDSKRAQSVPWQAHGIDGCYCHHQRGPAAAAHFLTDVPWRAGARLVVPALRLLGVGAGKGSITYRRRVTRIHGFECSINLRRPSLSQAVARAAGLLLIAAALPAGLPFSSGSAR